MGYLAAVIDTTEVPGILQIDLNQTDFYGEVKLPSFLYFNPTSSEQMVQCPGPQGQYDVYEAITESIMAKNQEGTLSLQIRPGGATGSVFFFGSGYYD